jgi:hypothetical protein
MLRRLIAAASCALLLVLLPMPAAQAKGAESATISGPGIDAVTVTYTGRGGGLSLDSLAEATRIYEILKIAADQRRAEVAAPATLGPAYTVDYEFFGEQVVQRVYPFASPWPSIYFPPGQELFDDKIASRWLRATPELRRVLVGLGATVVRPAVDAGAAGEEAAAEPVDVARALAQTDEEGAGSRWWFGFAALAAAAVALGGVRWRRHGSHGPDGEPLAH